MATTPGCSRQEHVHIHIHAGPELVLRVMDGPLDGDVARRFVHFGVDGGNLAGKLQALHAIRAHDQFFAESHLIELLLGQAELDVDGIDRLQRSDGGADVQILPQIYLPDADLAIEGSDDGLARDHGIGFRDRGIGLAKLAFRRVVVGLSDGFLGDQIPLPLEAEPRQFPPRLGGVKLRLLLPRIELHQQISLFDFAARNRTRSAKRCRPGRC